jgi:hypothetical protein
VLGPIKVWSGDAGATYELSATAYVLVHWGEGTAARREQRSSCGRRDKPTFAAKPVQKPCSEQRNRQQSPDRAYRSISGARPALSETAWKKSNWPVQGWGAVHQPPDSNSDWIRKGGNVTRYQIRKVRSPEAMGAHADRMELAGNGLPTEQNAGEAGRTTVDLTRRPKNVR